MQKFSRRPRCFAARSLLATWLGCVALAACALFAAEQPAAASRLGVGATFDTLQAGPTTYQHVRVRSVNARTLMIAHDGGLASVRLRDLSPELQAAFGYNPQSEAAADAALNEAEIRAEQARAKENAAKSRAALSKPSAGGGQFDRLMQSFGQPPEIRASVDLRPKYFALELNVKNQGPRPSCAVFAIVSALEFQNAQLTGQPERFSEEYLIWATCKTLHRAPRVRPDAAGGAAAQPEETDPVDEGFALSEVVTALRGYGIPLQSAMPYTFARANGEADPPGEIVAEARSRRRVSVFALPGRDQATRIANLVHTLNAGVPVAVGLRWPPWRTMRSGYLSTQPPLPEGGHAVTIVGYENKTGAIADTVFIFKNSWGVHWGAGGYGYATYGYLSNNLEETALLEVEPGEPAKAAR